MNLDFEKDLKKMVKKSKPSAKETKDKIIGRKNSDRTGNKGCFGMSPGQKATRNWLEKFNKTR